MNIQVMKVRDIAKLPTRKFPTDAGLDLYAVELDKVSPLSCNIIHTGIAVKLPKGYVGQVWPKSRSNFLIGGGIIDANYRGEILVKIVNFTVNEIMISPGDAIAQLVIVPVITPMPFEVTEEAFIDNTDRGATGGIVTQASQLTFIDKVDNKGLD